MSTITKTAYLTWTTNAKGGEFTVSSVDLSCLDHHTAIVNVEVEFDIGDFDSRLAEIGNLEKTLESVRAESQQKINLLLERISNLKAIGHEVAE